MNRTEDDGYESYDWDKIYKSLKIMSMVVYSLVFVLGVVGNGVVIWLTGKMEKTPYVVWYLNLALADFLVTAVLPLEITTKALDEPVAFRLVVFDVNMYVSIFTLAVMSVSVVCPGNRTVTQARWVSLGVWVLALVPSIPHFFFTATWTSDGKVQCYSNHQLFNHTRPRTSEEEQLRDFRSGAMIITRFLVGYVVPIAVIVSSFAVIIYRLRNKKASQSGHFLKTIATVIAMFFLCWAPFHIMRLIYLANHPVFQYTLMGLVIEFGYRISLALALLNSCLNPLLYVIIGSFKEGNRFFCCKRSIIGDLEKLFAEEPPQTNASAEDIDAEEPPQTNASAEDIELEVMPTKQLSLNAYIRTPLPRERQPNLPYSP